MATVRQRIPRAHRPARRTIRLRLRTVVPWSLATIALLGAGVPALAVDYPLAGISFASSWTDATCTTASITATQPSQATLRFHWLGVDLREISASTARMTSTTATVTAPADARAFVFSVLTPSGEVVPMASMTPATCQRIGDPPITGTTVVTTPPAAPTATPAVTMPVPGWPDGITLPDFFTSVATPAVPSATVGSDVVVGGSSPVTGAPTSTATVVASQSTQAMAYTSDAARIVLSPQDATTVRIDATRSRSGAASLVIRRASDREVIARMPMRASKTVHLLTQAGQAYVAQVERNGKHSELTSGSFEMARGAAALRYTGVQPSLATQPWSWAPAAAATTTVTRPTTTRPTTTRPMTTTSAARSASTTGSTTSQRTSAPSSPASTSSTTTSTTRTTTSTTTSAASASTTSSTSSSTTTSATPSTTSESIQPLPTLTTTTTSAPPLDIPPVLQENPLAADQSNPADRPLARTGAHSGPGILLGGGLLLLGGIIIVMARRMRMHD